jgi:hypothetical protein
VSSDGGLSNTAKRYLAGQTGRDYQCQIGVDSHTPFSAPWRGAQRESDKTELFKYVRSRPEGVPLSTVVGDVFSGEAVETAGGDYQLARRFYERHDCFLIARRDGILWVEPTVEAFHLSRQYANRKTTGRRGDGLSNGSEAGSTAGRGDESDCRTSRDGSTAGGSTTSDCRRATETTPGEVWRAQYPKDRAQAILDSRDRLDGGPRGEGHDYRAELLRELGTERVVQSDKFKILRRVRGTGEDYVLIPYTTRFNTASRAASIREGFRTALKTAAGRYGDAVVMTLTTDPGRHDCLTDAMGGLSTAKNRLMSWLATDYQLGYRPANLSVLEFTESGLPHVHVVLFGVSWVTTQAQLAAKWDDLGQGRVVDIRRTRSRGDRWLLHNDDGGTVTVRQYLGKAIDGLAEVADMDTGAVREAAEAGDVELWRQALYWATGRQYYSCSPSLKPSVDDSDGLPFVKRYEFVGAAEYSSIPAHVRRNSTVFVDRGRPPPDGIEDGGQSAG